MAACPFVERTYRLTAEEANTAIWLYLKGCDKPIPADARKLSLKWNAPGEVGVIYSEQVET